MYFSLLTFSLSIFSTLAVSSNYNQPKEHLSDVSKQFDRFKPAFNNSVNDLFKKIDQNTDDIMHLIKSHHGSRIKDTDYSSERPVSALLVIDVQNDFINGSLALRNCPSKHNGEEVVPVINHLIDSNNFDVVVYSYDWHPINHISFFDSLPLRSHLLTKDSKPVLNLRVYSSVTFNIPNLASMKQTLWPRHCVQNTFGAQLHPDLKIIDKNNNRNISVIHVYKGTKPNIDSYSAFWDNLKLSETTLNKQLVEKNVTQLFVTGIATDWCVYFTALHAMEHGYKTFIIEDACRGVDETLIKKKLDEFEQKNGHIIQSNQVKHYVK